MPPKQPPAVITRNRWEHLKRFTDARIALGRAGGSLPTQAHLEFQWAHAAARDAVHTPLDFAALAEALAQDGYPICQVQSRARQRAEYLQRPDLGRRLNDASCDRLQALQGEFDVAVIAADGLSSFAVQNHALPMLQAILPMLERMPCTISPVVLAEQGRVALSDDIGEQLQARLAIMLVGERPGLSAPDSLGIYLTYQPRLGRTDADRNCLSNIRQGGMSYADAAARLHFLVRESLARGYSGVRLKDETRVMDGVARGSGDWRRLLPEK